MTGVDVELIRQARALRPERVAALAAARRRRPLMRGDNRMLLVAADHPARGALRVRTDATAMENRIDLLSRLVTALRRPGVDGVLAAADVLTDLLLLGELDDKVVIGTMNRGGLHGSAFELDDRFTAFDVPTLRRMRFEGGKMLTRIDPADTASVRTLEHCATAVTRLAEAGLMALVEPFWSTRREGRVTNDLSPAAVARSVAIASGLGASSAYTWLKLPVVDDMERVMAATTLPVLLLGGDPSTRPGETYAAWRRALAVPGVRGLVVGRALLYPPDGDVAAAVDAAAAALGRGRP